jgi:hypothetical protein
MCGGAARRLVLKVNRVGSLDMSPPNTGIASHPAPAAAIIFRNSFRETIILCHPGLMQTLSLLSLSRIITARLNPGNYQVIRAARNAVFENKYRQGCAASAADNFESSS